MELRAIREYLRGGLWFAPAVGVLLSATAALAILAVDRGLGDRQVAMAFSGDPDSARTFLSTIAASMITLITLVFTITIVVLQLASQQFSPRVLRTFLRDRQSKVALAVFVGTFAFAVLVLREVRSQEALSGTPFVPRLSISATFLMVLLSLAAFVVYIHHIAQSVRAATILDVVGDETRRLIDDLYPADAEPRGPTFSSGGGPVTEVLSVRAPGVVTDFDAGSLSEVAREAGCVVELAPAVGDFVPTGSVLFRVHGEPGTLHEDRLRDEVSFGRERTMQQDVAFGFRQLVDVAIRALSPAVNDPTTAVQALDQIHDLLRRLGTRAFPPGEARDRSGEVRLVYRTTAWQSYVEMAFDEIRHHGVRHVQVVRRMRAAILDLLAAVAPERRPPLEEELRALDSAVESAFDLEHDRALAREADPKGLGD